MKMGTIASLWRYDTGTCRTLKRENIRLPAIWGYASRRRFSYFAVRSTAREIRQGLFHADALYQSALLTAPTDSAFQIEGARHSSLVAGIDARGRIPVVCVTG